ncbi:hypothetical protein [Ralstonia sp. UBA689]|uniref:hypothetical protein n=1 Tax=Ralstonia sp. UBA689 TaxID=1947373 RepID=UPI0025D6A735|nr:hypothetical protein [Ralstonia sp. UBA689]
MSKAYLRSDKEWLMVVRKNALIRRMQKSHAIRILGGTPVAAARAIGVTTQALSQWPAVLPPRLEDRVVAAAARLYLGAQLSIVLAGNHALSDAAAH